MPLSASAALRLKALACVSGLGLLCSRSVAGASVSVASVLSACLGSSRGSWLTAVVVPASFGVVDPEIPPLPSFPRSPGKKGDGSLGGPLASAKGAGVSQESLALDPLPGTVPGGEFDWGGTSVKR